MNKKLTTRPANMINNELLDDQIKLANSLLPEEIECLYIELSNEILSYANILNEQKEINTLIANNSLCLIHLSNRLVHSDEKEKEKIKTICKDLKIKRAILNKKAASYSYIANQSLDRMLGLIDKMREDKSIDDLSLTTSNNLVSRYTDLRIVCYRIIKYVGTYIIKNKPLDRSNKNLLELAVNSLNEFDLERILLNPQKESIGELMDLITLYLSKQDCNFQKFESVKKEMVKSQYSDIIEILDDVYITEKQLSIN